MKVNSKLSLGHEFVLGRICPCRHIHTEETCRKCTVCGSVEADHYLPAPEKAPKTPELPLEPLPQPHEFQARFDAPEKCSFVVYVGTGHPGECVAKKEWHPNGRPAHLPEPHASLETSRTPAPTERQVDELRQEVIRDFQKPVHPALRERMVSGLDDLLSMYTDYRLLPLRSENAALKAFNAHLKVEQYSPRYCDTCRAAESALRETEKGK